MGASEKTWVNNSSPTCDADDLNGFNLEINNAITGDGQTLNYDIEHEQLNIAINQRNIKYYNASISYDTYDVVRKTGTTELYRSYISDNLGNALPSEESDANWEYLGKLKSLNEDITAVISGTEIDWNKRIHYITTVDDIEFTFENMKNKVIRVAVTDSESKAVTWPSYVQWDNNSIPSQTALKTDVYEFEYINGTVYGKRVYVNCGGAWPYGLDGNLTIGNGETVEIAAGSIKDYNDVSIASGGILRITGNSVNFTIIGVAGDLTLAGTIECKGSTAVGTGTATTPDNIEITHTITQQNGGAGGVGGDGAGTNGGAGGAQNSGNGGGGGGGHGEFGGIGFVSGGAGGSGAGGSAGNGTHPGSGGSVGTTTNGSNASTVYGGNGGNGGGGGGGGGGYSFEVQNQGGGGGGGGLKGTHGKNIYIRVSGTFNGTDGIIDVSGSNGSNGGNGGVGIGAGKGGGGGGGGAGGSGGKVYVRHSGALNYTAPTYTVAGGSAGSGGTKGSTSAGNGSAGTAGSAGSSDVAEYGA